MDKDNGVSSAPCSSSSLRITWLPNRQDLWSPSTVKNAIMMNFRANYNYYTYALNFTRVAAWVLKFVCSAESAATNASPSIWLDCLLIGLRHHHHHHRRFLRCRRLMQISIITEEWKLMKTLCSPFCSSFSQSSLSDLSRKRLIYTLATATALPPIFVFFVSLRKTLVSN